MFNRFLIILMLMPLYSCSYRADNCETISKQVFSNFEIINANPQNYINSDLLRVQDSLIKLIDFDCQYFKYIIDIKYSLDIYYKNYYEGITFISNIPDSLFTNKIDKEFKVQVLLLNHLYEADSLSEFNLVRNNLIEYLVKHNEDSNSLFISMLIEEVNAIEMDTSKIQDRIEYIKGNQHLFFGDNYLILTTALEKIKRTKEENNITQKKAKKEDSSKYVRDATLQHQK
jgi:hypothetical protein